MKVIIQTLEGQQTIEGVAKIIGMGETIVLACEDNAEYNTRVDFPTMYRMEIEPDG